MAGQINDAAKKIDRFLHFLPIRYPIPAGLPPAYMPQTHKPLSIRPAPKEPCKILKLQLQNQKHYIQMYASKVLLQFSSSYR